MVTTHRRSRHKTLPQVLRTMGEGRTIGQLTLATADVDAEGLEKTVHCRHVMSQGREGVCQLHNQPDTDKHGGITGRE